MTNQTIRTPLTVLAALAVVYVWGNCRESAGASKQRLRDSTGTVDAHRLITDKRVARMAAESSQMVGQLRRFARNDSVARGEIARLRSNTVITVTDSTPRELLITQLAIKDSIIAQQDVALAAADTQVTIWKALAVERGDLLTRALQERDAYAKIAQAWQGKAGKHFGCAGGPAVVASLDGHVSAGVGIACGIRL